MSFSTASFCLWLLLFLLKHRNSLAATAPMERVSSWAGTYVPCLVTPIHLNHQVVGYSGKHMETRSSAGRNCRLAPCGSTHLPDLHGFCLRPTGKAGRV